MVEAYGFFTVTSYLVLQNVVTRVTSIPLISSAYNTCITLYNYAKGTHPYVKTACLVAETLAAVAVGSAVGGAQPILNHLEPQSEYKDPLLAREWERAEESLVPVEKTIPHFVNLLGKWPDLYPCLAPLC